MTSEYKFEQFTYYIVSAFSEFLNDIQQHSYEKLTDKWWQSCHTEIESIIMDSNVIPTDIKNILVDRVINEFSKDFLTQEQTKALKNLIYKPFRSYYIKYHNIHYCGDIDCYYDCGVISCGCIDLCRGRCNRGYKHHMY